MPSDEGLTLQRLHPLSLLFSLAKAARGLLLPGIVVLFLSPGGNYDIWLMIFFIPAAVMSAIKYLTYRYRLGDDEMIVREGVLTRNERHIPYARIQNVNLVQNPLHRLLNVAEVHVETASGSKPEAIIRVLSLSAVEAIRERVSRERGGLGGAEAAHDASAQLLLELSFRDLVVLGLISNRGMAVIAAFMGLLWQFDLWDLDLERIAERAPEWTSKFGISSKPGVLASVALGLATLIVLVALMRVLSIGWAILRYYGFVLRRSGHDLRARYGLFTRYTAVIPTHRIQLLSSHSTPLHRLWGRTGVLAETAGGGAGNDGDQPQGTHRLWLAPIITTDAVHELRRQVLPDVDLEIAQWVPLPARARMRVRNRALIWVALVSGGAAFGIGWWALALALLGVPWALLHAAWWWKRAAWSRLSTAIAFRSGWWTQRVSVVRFAKIQTVSLTQSPFDRRHAMARLQVDTAGAGKAGHRVSIPFLPLDLARDLHQQLAHEAARHSFRW